MIGTDYPVINPMTSVVDNVMMMMFLIERSECDDDDIPDRKIKV